MFNLNMTSGCSALCHTALVFGQKDAMTYNFPSGSFKVRTLINIYYKIFKNCLGYKFESYIIGAV